MRCVGCFRKVAARALPTPCVPSPVRCSGVVASAEPRRSTFGSSPCLAGSRQGQDTRIRSHSETTETACARETAIRHWPCAGYHQRLLVRTGAGRDWAPGSRAARSQWDVMSAAWHCYSQPMTLPPGCRHAGERGGNRFACTGRRCRAEAYRHPKDRRWATSTWSAGQEMVLTWGSRGWTDGLLLNEPEKPCLSSPRGQQPWPPPPPRSSHCDGSGDG
jgi:hypothetical protein